MEQSPKEVDAVWISGIFVYFVEAASQTFLWNLENDLKNSRFWVFVSYYCTVTYLQNMNSMKDCSGSGATLEFQLWFWTPEVLMMVRSQQGDWNLRVLDSPAQEGFPASQFSLQFLAFQGSFFLETCWNNDISLSKSREQEIVPNSFGWQEPFIFSMALRLYHGTPRSTFYGYPWANAWKFDTRGDSWRTQASEGGGMLGMLLETSILCWIVATNPLRHCIDGSFFRFFGRQKLFNSKTSVGLVQTAWQLWRQVAFAMEKGAVVDLPHLGLGKGISVQRQGWWILDPLEIDSIWCYEMLDANWYIKCRCLASVVRIFEARVQPGNGDSWLGLGCGQRSWYRCWPGSSADQFVSISIWCLHNRC